MVIGTSCGSILLVAHAALADDERDDEGRDARRDVDDGAAREVEGTHLEQPATGRPDHVGQRGVDDAATR